VKREAEESIDECLYDMKNDPFQKGKNGIRGKRWCHREYVWGESKSPRRRQGAEEGGFLSSRQTDRQTGQGVGGRMVRVSSMHSIGLAYMPLVTNALITNGG